MRPAAAAYGHGVAGAAVTGALATVFRGVQDRGPGGGADQWWPAAEYVAGLHAATAHAGRMQAGPRVVPNGDPAPWRVRVTIAGPE